MGSVKLLHLLHGDGVHCLAMLQPSLLTMLQLWLLGGCTACLLPLLELWLLGDDVLCTACLLHMQQVLLLGDGVLVLHADGLVQLGCSPLRWCSAWLQAGTPWSSWSAL